MTDATYQDKIKNMISNEVLVGISVDEIGDDASLISDLNLDSIQMLALITGLETEFGFTLDEDDLDLENLSSVTRLAEFVEKKLSAS